MSTYVYLGNNFSNRFGDKFFDVNITKVYVNGTNCCNQYAVYEITMRKGKSTWTLKKRYKDFFALHEDVCDYDVSSGGIFPAKTYFPCVDTDFIEDRREKLQEYLSAVLNKMSQKDSIKSNSRICQFLNMP